MLITLRPYQTEALTRIDAAAERGVRRLLGVAATGLGKTVIFCALAERMNARTLILAHRDELVSQAVAKVREVWPGVNVGIVKAGANDVGAHVVVASVQTLAKPKRLAQLLRGDDPFDLVVVDEAHHTAATTYGAILEALGCNRPDGPLLLGVTATPDRGDGKGLVAHYDEIVWAYDLRWGIANEYLCNLRGLRVTLQMDFGQLRKSHGDYDQGQAGQMLTDADAPEAIVAAWQEHASQRRTLVFTPTVATAELISDEFNLRGVAASWVCGATPLDERRATLAAYAAGQIQVLCNCAVLTEGYDDPRTDCIVIARPTQSRAFYTQMVGRGTRRHPDKEDLLVIDVVGVTGTHSLVTVPSLFGIEKTERASNDSGPSELLTDILHDQIEEHRLAGILLAEEADLFSAVRGSGFAWVAVHKTGERQRYEVSLSSRDGLVLVRLPNDEWRAGYWRRDFNDEISKTVLIDGTLETAQSTAEELARTLYHGDSPLTSATAKWRDEPATAKQKKMLRYLNVAPFKGMTKGQAADLITRVQATHGHKPLFK